MPELLYSRVHILQHTDPNSIPGTIYSSPIPAVSIARPKTKQTKIQTLLFGQVVRRVINVCLFFHLDKSHLSDSYSSSAYLFCIN